MLKSQLEESNKIYDNMKKEILNKYRKGISTLNIDNMRNENKFFHGLNFFNSKARPGTESQDKNNEKAKNLTIIQTKEKNRLKIKNSIIKKKNEFSFPKINNLKDKNTNEMNYLKKKFSIYSDASSKWVNKIKSLNRDNNKKNSMNE